MGFSGNLGELDRMAREMGRLEAGLIRRVAREGAFEVRRELGITLAARQTPYGAPWAPRKDGKRLADMSDAVRVTSAEATITARTVGKEAALHHSGTSRMPARRMIPMPSSSMPTAWKLGLDRAFRRSVAFFLRSA
jgi:hypothetical protein